MTTQVCVIRPNSSVTFNAFTLHPTVVCYPVPLIVVVLPRFLHTTCNNNGQLSRFDYYFNCNFLFGCNYCDISPPLFHWGFHVIRFGQHSCDVRWEIRSQIVVVFIERGVAF